MEESKVKVVLRCRPLLAREGVGGSGQPPTSAFQVSSGHRQVVLGDGKSFNFDHVYDPSCEQQQIYEECVSPLVEGCFRGFNATVLAYGQTGSG